MVSTSSIGSSSQTLSGFGVKCLSWELATWWPIDHGSITSEHSCIFFLFCFLFFPSSFYSFVLLLLCQKKSIIMSWGWGTGGVDQTVTICQFSPCVSTLFSQWISLTSIKSWYLTSHEPVDSSKLYTLIICSLLYDDYTSVKLFIQKSKKWKVVLLHGGLSFFCEAHTPLSSIRN